RLLQPGAGLHHAARRSPRWPVPAQDNECGDLFFQKTPAALPRRLLGPHVYRDRHAVTGAVEILRRAMADEGQFAELACPGAIPELERGMSDFLDRSIPPPERIDHDLLLAGLATDIQRLGALISLGRVELIHVGQR